MAIFIHKRHESLECLIDRDELLFDEVGNQAPEMYRKDCAQMLLFALGSNFAALYVQDAIEILGQGRFGMVVKAKFRGTTVVVKRAVPSKPGKRASADGTDSEPLLIIGSKSSFHMRRFRRPTANSGADRYGPDGSARSPLLRQLTFANNAVKVVEPTAQADLEELNGVESTPNDQRLPNFVPSKSDAVIIDTVRCLLLGSSARVPL